jgi:O-antigen ligase
MKRRPADTPQAAYVAPISALFVTCALGLAVFYQGPQFPLLAGAQFLLITWVALSLACSYESGVRLPLTPLSVTLTLFWIWLGVSLLWSAVLATSIINFWWVGSFALVFWAYTLSPQRERVWFYASRFAVLGALALCGYALIQLFMWREPPRATFVNIHSFAALMMLVALSLGGYFLIAWQHGATPRVRYLLGACLFVLYFTIASTGGRGTTLSIALSLTVFVLLSRRVVDRRGLLTLVGIMVGAYAAANLLLHGGIEDRMATLADPASAAFPRLLIWRGSWELLLREPLWGIGLGTYYLAWPPFRDPVDDTLGFFVHNDYLQIWIEAGLPALLLLLAVFVSAAFLLFRLLRQRTSVVLRLEALGLFAGLLAVAAHSFLDFNLYILSISIAAGLVLGRFHDCVFQAVPPREYRIRPERAMQAHAYRVIAVLIALFPLTYFVALGLSDYLYKRAYDEAAAGKLVDADNTFSWAERLTPRDDRVLTMHADLYRHVMQRLPQAESAERRTLYEAALALLEEAQSANPYRSLVHVVRGRILEGNAALTGPDWRERAESEYTKAIALNPRFIAARVEYATLLLNAGREREAYRILDTGIDLWYYPGSVPLGYYEFTLHLARKLGESERAKDVEQRLIAMREAIAKTAPARPVVPDLTTPSPPSSSSS